MKHYVVVKLIHFNNSVWVFWKEVISVAAFPPKTRWNKLINVVPHWEQLFVSLSHTVSLVSWEMKKIPGRICAHLTQEKKQLTAMPHLLANNQGKLSLKQYKMSPQADALSARIMRFWLPRMLSTHFNAFIIFKFCWWKSCLPLPSKQIVQEAWNIWVTTSQKTWRISVCPLAPDTYC